MGNVQDFAGNRVLSARIYLCYLCFACDPAVGPVLLCYLCENALSREKRRISDDIFRAFREIFVIFLRKSCAFWSDFTCVAPVLPVFYL